MATTNPSPPGKMAVQSHVALVSYINMFSIGTAYALSILQIELPRLLDVPYHWSFAPFGSASLGLAAGVATAASSISTSGARSTTAKGTGLWGLAVLLAGHSLSSLNFHGILAALFVGGVGVGWTYLAVIVMVSQAFPDRPLIRSAIGPLGFSSGAAASFVVSTFLRFGSRDAGELGGFFKVGGVAFVTVGAATVMLLPSDVASSKKEPSSGASKRGFFWVLLFFNALPGMTAFSALLPAASYYNSTSSDRSPSGLPYAMLALASGGLFSSAVSSRLGPNRTFTVLFSVRGALLIALWRSTSQTLAFVTLATILFAHGVGFSYIPGLIKTQLASASEFPREYGRVLTAWGAAGVVASLLNAALHDDFSSVSLVLGLTVLFVAVVGELASPLDG
ncbi:major facilitator transporter [Colletotrichum karsti]|uniref:Major facilitator transporter n=1 Tax=Colletotrichum karsti TaxID=1095194 RepID=A0A9P6IBU1_9PEZI|nr:major facilitator transporter [Colletotrichum karsti]KAF9877641.1 major facilitator transporter [Colletotrichum karsti]